MCLLLTLAEAAERLRVSVKTVRREIADGRLNPVRVRSRILLRQSDLDNYIACQSAGGATAGRSGYHSAVAAALSKHFPPELPEPTRSRSKFRSAARKSTPRLVVVRTSR